jgi:hemolysin-activating ACP:hemolysin acyltransferase
VPQAIHLQILETATWAKLQPELDELLHQATKPSSKNEPTYLWFVDLLTPFSHALAATQELKHHLSIHTQAWALNINQGQCVPRQVW